MAAQWRELDTRWREGFGGRHFFSQLCKISSEKFFNNSPGKYHVVLFAVATLHLSLEYRKSQQLSIGMMEQWVRMQFCRRHM